MAILLKKMTIFVNVFEKNVKFWAIFWHSIGNFPEGQAGEITNEPYKNKDTQCIMYMNLYKPQELSI